MLSCYIINTWKLVKWRLAVTVMVSKGITCFPSPLNYLHKTQKCRNLRLTLMNNEGVVYFPVRLCFVTLSTMSVSHSVIIWRQRHRRGGGQRQPSLSAAVNRNQYCLKTLRLTFNPLDHPKSNFFHLTWWYPQMSSAPRSRNKLENIITILMTISIRNILKTSSVIKMSISVLFNYFFLLFNQSGHYY